MGISECPEPAWSEGYFKFLGLDERPKRMLEPLVEKLHAVLKKEAGSERDLKDVYYHSLLDMIKAAFSSKFEVPRDALKDPDFMSYVVDHAFYRRWTDVRNHKMSRFEEVMGRR